MNAIEIFRSNDAEALLNALNARLRVPLSDPFAKEMIVVQGRGMAVWLSQQLAQRQGIWANAEFVYPKNFVRRAFAEVLPGVNTDEDPFSRQRLLWEVMALLPSRLSSPVFAPLARYLSGDADGSRMFQLSQRISDSFDEYVTFRPELLHRWERPKAAAEQRQLDLFSAAPGSGDHEAWQEALWRELIDKHGCVHNAALERKFQQALSKKRTPKALPERISIFGLSSLPPQYVRVLAALSTQTQVQLFLLSPSREYYSEAIRKRAGDATSTHQNPLLLSYGALGAELQEVITTQLEALGVAEQGHDLYTDPAGLDDKTGGPAEAGGDRKAGVKKAAGRPKGVEGALSSNVLKTLQQDILNHQNGPALGRLALRPEDESVALHSCHSAIREVEVLHDQLLALMDGPDAVRPNEIVVMTPNVDDYAALIEAVFERSRDDTRAIPYRISDRSLQADSGVLDAFLRILALAESRASASELLDVLALEPVRERFKIAATDVAQIADWVVKSGIRWGFDAQHRAAHELPEDAQNTWEFGLHRLLMGYAVSSEEALSLGVLPFPEIEGKTALLLGRFVHFVETLFEHLRGLSKPRSVEDWQAALTSLLTQLLAETTSNAWQHQQAVSAFSEMVQNSSTAGFDSKLHLKVVRELLSSQFDSNRDARGFLSGGVTFCAMVPMRSIPFRVVCLLGMNDGAFPRRSHRADFNLVDHGGEPRQLGDPNRRVDDRYLFLEALLSARERLIITFVGQSVRDNARVPPSIVVTELLDYLLTQYAGDDEIARDRVRLELVTVHPLQPFSPRYFDTSNRRLFSFEQAFLKGAKLLGPERRPASPLFTSPLPPEEASTTLELSELEDFFSAPASHLLRRRLRVQLEEDDLSIPDREPLQLSGLQGYQVGAPVLAQKLGGLTKEHSLELTVAAGALPSGAPGVFEFERILKNAEPIAESAELIRGGEEVRPKPFLLPLTERVELRGELSQLWAAGHATVQYSRIRGKHLIRSWLRHLVLSAVAPEGVAPYTWLIGRPEKGDGRRICRFSPVAEPIQHLKNLLELFQTGQEFPLMWFPDSSISFVKALTASRGTLQSALYHAGQAWRTERDYSRALQRLYGKESELSEAGPGTPETTPLLAFSEVARRIAEPLLEHLEEVA